jgi:AraC-like DNA-binding protein
VASQLVRMHTIPGCEGLELVEGGYVDFRFARHAHPHFSIGVNSHGAQRFSHRGREMIVRRGELILLNPDEAHSNEPAENSWNCVSLCPTSAVLTCLMPELGDSKIRSHFAVVRDSHFAIRIIDLLGRYARRASALELQELYINLLADIFHRYGSRRINARFSAPIERVRERLADSPEANISLSELADEVGTSPTMLLRSFTKAVGCTPHTYQTARRVYRSRQLLRDGTSIVEAALLCGFVDQSHFTRVFKRWTGTTPARYCAEAHRANGIES